LTVKKRIISKQHAVQSHLSRRSIFNIRQAKSLRNIPK